MNRKRAHLPARRNGEHTYMKWTGLNELREMFLRFFESKQHLRLPSFPLVPHGDKSLLLINSGMAPMKKWFLGTEEPPSHRVCTCQKCIRTPDIESVGITARHGTYFEMLGNFSFQNYFKKEAIHWAWELFTSDGWLAIPADKLYVSIYEEDEDAFAIWTDEEGVPADRVVRLGKADNFWEHGSGPCGPCSEIYFDRGPAFGCGEPDCKPGCDCDRYMEVWNLVFTEFDSDGAGHYEKLAAPNIDTGMGLERLACVMQEVNNLFEVDTVRNILNQVESLSGKTYGQDRGTDISIRVITDHIRSTVFMVSDGVLPSNEGRGYVLRRLLRRAARHGRMLGIKGPFLEQLTETVITQNEGAYPELRENASFIKRNIAAEEERFSRTLDEGLKRLNDMLEEMGPGGQALKEFGLAATKAAGDMHTDAKQALDGLVNQMTTNAYLAAEQARAQLADVKNGFDRWLASDKVFQLHDTFGFPFDLTREIAAERGVGVDEEGFRAELQKQREQARKDRLARDIGGWEGNLFAETDLAPTAFVGYEALVTEAKVLAIAAGDALVDETSAADGEQTVLIVLDKTPFYAEAGGQVADTGTLTGEGARLAVDHVKKDAGGLYVHTCVLETGSVQAGQTLLAEVDADRRHAIMRNHTSAHLLQRALRDVLGEHVHQQGSYVDDERMRFDFTHFEALTPEELREAEQLVNRAVFSALPVTVQNLPIEEAKKMGAMALFGEKYGDVVRVVDVNGWSTEFCGGTHVTNTAQLGSFKILAESSVAAGVRRIESTTGYGVLRLLDQKDEMLAEMAGTLKVNNPSDLPTRVTTLAADVKSMEKELERLNDLAADAKAENLFKDAIEVDGVQVITMFMGGTAPDALRKMCDRMRENRPNAVGALCGEADGKVTLAVACGEDAVKRGLKAGAIAKEIAAIAGGSGGGRPDFAMAGIKDATKVDEALAALPGIVEKTLKN